MLRVKERTRLHGVAGAGAAALIPARRRAEAVGRHAAYAIDGLSTSCTRFSSPGTADRSSNPTVLFYRSRSGVDQQVRLAHGRSWPKGSSCRFLPKLASSTMTSPCLSVSQDYLIFYASRGTLNSRIRTLLPLVALCTDTLAFAPIPKARCVTGTRLHSQLKSPRLYNHD